MTSRRNVLKCAYASLMPALLPVHGSCATAAEPAQLSAEIQEKHALYLLLAYALVASRWRVHRGDPEERAAYAQAYPGQPFSEYFGHNIGALLMGPRDDVIAFEMNDAAVSLSSLEHAEAKAVRVANKRLNLQRYREGSAAASYADLFGGCTLYTTLESCSQCIGVMHLAGLDTVVYGQADALQQEIGKTIYLQYRGGPLPAPQPVRADFFPLFNKIEAAYAGFQAEARAKGRPIGTTAFLASLRAYEIFASAKPLLDGFVLVHPQNKWHKQHAMAIYSGLTNPEVGNAFID